MTDTPSQTELSQAFDHPLARSEAAGDPLDRISLRDHIVEVEIGAFQVERDITQRLSFNVVVEVAPVTAPLEDDVDRILSYDKVTEAIALELAAERLNLLETLAERIAARILAEPQAIRVFLRIEKLDRGPFKLGVEIVRSQRQLDAPVDPLPEEAGVGPALLLLSPQATDSAQLSQYLDQLAGTALVVCPPAPALPRPDAGTEAAARQIDLLALDQAAWALASRDARCSVTNSRTELDWALKQGHVCVWAPAKMITDAVTPPASIDPAALVHWLAGELGASELVLIDAEAPEGLDLPQRAITL